MSTPTAEQLHAAATWLDCYDGADDDEYGPACVAVAAWLRERAERAEQSSRVAQLQSELHAETGKRPTAAQVRHALGI